YPYKQLCCCGVGFKLICALTEKLNLRPDIYAYRYLDLVATAIAADIVPITGENRILAYHGLLQANTKPSLGIAALMQLSGVQQAMQIQNLVFMIAPRVNAAGRMDDAKKAVQMFIAETVEEAMHYAEMLHADNYNRKEKDSSITAEALEMIQKNPALQQRKSTVLFQPHWHKGVVGIVASRLTEHYYRPTIVLTQSGDMLSGSARSVAGFNLYEAIHACREHLVAYGGHFAAAGLSLLPENLEAFSTAFEAAVSSTIDPQLLIPEIVIDAEINFNDIQMPFYNIIQQMEPFGPENMKPVFVSRNVHDKGFSKVVKEEHLRFVLQQNQHTLTGIAFGKADMLPLLQRGPVDVVYHIEKNEYNGNTSLQLRVLDFRPSEGKF
ncbi:MAG: single-stranded-DNA-specific exonuclease RecJ, partial [Chitinophagaceae bacterium]